MNINNKKARKTTPQKEMSHTNESSVHQLLACIIDSTGILIRGMVCGCQPKMVVKGFCEFGRSINLQSINLLMYLPLLRSTFILPRLLLLLLVLLLLTTAAVIVTIKNVIPRNENDINLTRCHRLIKKIFGGFPILTSPQHPQKEKKKHKRMEKQKILPAKKHRRKASMSIVKDRIVKDF